MSLFGVFATAVHVLAGSTFVASGVPKLVAPGGLLAVLRRGGFARVANRSVVLVLGGVELVLGGALLAFPSGTRLHVIAAAAVTAYLVAVTPVGVVLLSRTGSCGCSSNLSQSSMSGPSLVLRNAMLLGGVAAYASGAAHAGAFAGVGAALTLGAAAAAGRSLHRSVQVGRRVSGWLDRRRAVAAVQATFVE